MVCKWTNLKYSLKVFSHTCHLSDKYFILLNNVHAILVLFYHNLVLPGRVAQSVTCLATDACLTADPGVASSIPVLSHTFLEIDHEMISTVILLLPLIHSRRVVVGYKRKYVHELLVTCPGKSVVRWTDRPTMTIAVDLGRKATKQTNKTILFYAPVINIFFKVCVLSSASVLCPFYCFILYVLVYM